MKKLYFLFLISFLFVAGNLFSNGVAIKNAQNSEYFKLLSSDIHVSVFDQIAIVVTTQKYLNNTGEKSKIKYAFPLAEGASGIGLRWNLYGNWYSADLSPSPQDTTLPGGGGSNDDLMAYLGATPLFFPLEDSIANDSILIIELTYVQLLPYDYYRVDFHYPNNYSLIQDDILDYQHILFQLESQRTITNINLTSHEADNIYFNDSIAEFEYTKWESTANDDYVAYYELSPDDLGLFNYSTFITDTAFDCDNYGNGFFTFIVEPDPQSEVINKVFTLIIDRSGSMYGNKIVQARDAAAYIVSNLNEGDYFNLVDFSTYVTSLYSDHVAFDATTESEALNYISTMDASGSTNISGAFSTAIPDFSSTDTTAANIIVFFTDGEATVGILETEGILQHIKDLININEVINLQIHTFGIGDYTNESLLSQIASQNNGLSEFLGDDELEEVITSFYRKIRNPVLINTEMEINPPVLTQIFPDPLENLYLGQQLIITGRYQEAVPVEVTFSGQAFGQPQSYQYTVDLADTSIATYQFLTKVWAKEKMKNLFILYLTYDEESPEAEEIKNEIIDISICYNVISPFTSYTGGGGGTTGIEFESFDETNPKDLKSYAYPNPFLYEANIHFSVTEEYFEIATINIFDALGRILDVTFIQLNGKGNYTITWNGKDKKGNPVPTGYYFYTIHFGDKVLTGKMVKQ